MLLKLPSTLAMTLLCSCHTGGEHPTDASDTIAPITDARPLRIDAAVADAATTDAPRDGASDAVADAMADARADAMADAGLPDAMADAGLPDAIPDADLA